MINMLQKKIFDTLVRLPEPKNVGLDALFLKIPDSELKVEPWLEGYLADKLKSIKGGVLDIACGDGYFAHYLSTLASHRVHGIDIDPRAIDMASQKHHADNLDFAVGSVYDLSKFQDLGFVSVIHALHHFDDLNGALDQIVASLSPTGAILIQDWERTFAIPYLI